MIKLKKINERLVKSLTAFTLATTSSFTAVPIVSEVHATEGEMCYNEEILAKFKTIAGDYIIKKYYDNSLEIIETNSKYTNRLKLSSDGTVEIRSQNKKHLGLFNDYTEEKFKINNFNPQKLDVDTKNIRDKNLKKTIKSLSNYLKSNTFNNINYIELLGEDLMDGMCYNNGREIKETTKNQYNDMLNNYYNELQNSGIIKSSSLALGLTSSTLVGTEGLAIAGITINPTTVLAILLVIGLCAEGAYINDRLVYPVDNIDDYTYDIDGINLNDRTTWLTIADAMDTIETNYSDNNPDNDYYQAIINENNVYINFINPLSIEQASNLLKVPGLDLKNNIYTYQPEDAKHVIEYSGGIAGTSSGKKEFINRAECHAFAQSYSEFNSYNYSYNLGQLMLKPGVKPGVYYWHYHFNGKFINLVNREGFNSKHIFFGVPIIVTQNDINKYSSRSNVFGSDMDNYEIIKNEYSRSKSLKK